MPSRDRNTGSSPRPAPSGLSVSTIFGQPSVRPYQVGFPATLTSTFNPQTGYAWTQNVLDLTVPGVDTPDLPLSGVNAYTPDNNQSLTVGTCGWMEVDPQSQGWLFIPTGQCGTTTTASPACTGYCYWVYTASTLSWTLQSSACSPAGACTVGCNCLAPDFCPSENASTVTSCAALSENQQNPCCGSTVPSQTTASPCTGNYTATCVPLSQGGCLAYLWQCTGCSADWCCPYSGACTQANSISPPVTGTCSPSSGGGGGSNNPACACSGCCCWTWTSTGWGLNDCGDGGGPACGACGCDPPQYAGAYVGQVVCTPYYVDGGLSNYCCTGQTCGSPGPCDGVCTWVSTDGSTWTLQSGCLECSCYPPAAAPVAVGQQATNSCQPTYTTTTASPITTTTTTASPCPGTCEWVYNCCYGGNWVLQSNGCAGTGCVCEYPEITPPCGPSGSPQPAGVFTATTQCTNQTVTTPTPGTTTVSPACSSTTTTTTTTGNPWYCCYCPDQGEFPYSCVQGVGNPCPAGCVPPGAFWASQLACLTHCGPDVTTTTTTGTPTTTTGGAPPPH